MAAKADPRALLFQWKLRGAFEMVVVQPPINNKRAQFKVFGIVSEMGYTSKGKIGNMPDQMLMFVNTTMQAENNPAYSVQVSKLDLFELTQH